MVPIRFEQAVYGSFPFWDRGYDVLARSPGCRPEWLADLRAACQRYGERPRGAAEAGGLFALRLPSGPWAIVGPGVQGADDRGRPGALAFHALLLSPREYRRAGSSPFGLAGALRRQWGPETTSLPPGTRDVAPPDPGPGPGMADDRARRIAAAMAGGRRVAVEADGPIDALAGRVWGLLPARVRRRASVATWAFGNANRFDLVALPRLAGADLDASYRDAATLDDAGPRSAAGDRPPGARRRAIVRLLVGAGIAAGAAAGLVALRRRGGTAPPSPPIDASPPDASPYRDARPAPDERARVAEGLADLAQRCGVVAAGDPEADPTALMVLLAERLRYPGPFLSAEELDGLAAEPDPDRSRALALHARVRRFAADRPLPAGFARGPLRWQLDVLTWSFHGEPDPRLSAAEVPHALAHDLAVEGPIRPGPLDARYPALASYARFLRRLPGR